VETFWIDGYKIAAASKTQALQAAAYLKKRDAETRVCSCGCAYGSRPDYRSQVCKPNPPPC
jgi:hypothetical protein